MKKLLALLAALTAVLLLVSCADVDEENPEGWIDEDTFKVSVIGYAKYSDDPNVLRKWKATAYTAAEMVAAETIMRKMIGSYIESTGATEDNELIGKVVKEKAEGTIVGYMIEVADYDELDYSCRVVATMQKDGLKEAMNDRIDQWFDEMGNIGGAAAPAE